MFSSVVQNVKKVPLVTIHYNFVVKFVVSFRVRFNGHIKQKKGCPQFVDTLFVCLVVDNVPPILSDLLFIGIDVIQPIVGKVCPNLRLIGIVLGHGSAVIGSEGIHYDRLEYALMNDSENQILAFYVNKNKATAVLRKAGYTITGWPNIHNGFNRSISNPHSPVNLRISTQIDTRQFKNWFKGSKV